MNTCYFIFIVVAYTSVGKVYTQFQDETVGYFWKNYNGSVPSNALKFANGMTQEVYYIGQGDAEGSLLPGMLRDGMREMQVSKSGNVLTVSENLKIFCTNSPYRFTWIPTTYQGFEEMMQVPHFEGVPGGNENEMVVYIGELMTPDYMNVGKISTKRPHQGLIIPDENGKATVYKSFKALFCMGKCSETEIQDYSELKFDPNANFDN